jgi:hypothetical protein
VNAEAGLVHSAAAAAAVEYSSVDDGAFAALEFEVYAGVGIIDDTAVEFKADVLTGEAW